MLRAEAHLRRLHTKMGVPRATISRSMSPIRDGARRLVSSRPCPAHNNSIVEFICTTRLAAASALFARGSLSIKRSARCSWWRARTSVVRCRVPATRRVCRRSLGNRSTRSLSHTRHATPSQSSGTLRTDGLCIFKTPKKARFDAAHVASTDVMASTSSRLRELVSLQHACHMLRCHSNTTHMCLTAY